jgi:methyltransferase (TIGR00027 family)
VAGVLTAADTAYAMAAIRAKEAELPEAERLFVDPFAARFWAAGAHAEDGTQRLLVLPFMRESIRVRTRFIDDFVRDGLAAGVRQVVLLGAGFDTRALRLPEVSEAGAVVYEVDFPEQLARKRAALDAGGIAIPDAVRYVSCDFLAAQFDRALAADLEARGFRAGAGALFVWEGVLAYIDDAAIDTTLAFAARAGGGGSRLVFDYPEFRFEPEPVESRTRRAGFSRFEATPFADLYQRLLRMEAPPQAGPFHMGVAYVD